MMRKLATQQPEALPSYSRPVNDYIDHNMRADHGSSRGFLDVGLGGLNRAFRAASFGSPIVGAALTAAGLGALGYAAGPWLTKGLRRVMSPRLRRLGMDDGEDTDAMFEDPEVKQEARKRWGIALGGMAALATLGLNLAPNAPWYGLKRYAPLRKTESGSSWNSMTIGEGMQLLQDTPNLSAEAKTQSMQLLGSFNKPLNTPITGGDVVGQAIATGRSAACGAAIGYLTANLLGLPNPSSTAILGAVANTLGPYPALVGSMVFGQ